MLGYKQTRLSALYMRRIRPKFWYVFSFIAIWMILCFPIQSANWLTSKYDVKNVISGDRFAIDFNGIQLIVNLASVKVTKSDDAKLALKQWLEGNKVTIIPESEAGTTAEGFQRVYVFAFQGSKKSFINQEMIEKGYAEYVKVKSKSYGKLQDAMSETQEKILKETAGSSSSLDKEVMEKGMFKTVSELYSKKYHRTECRWANMIHPQSQIIYDSYQDAELAKKFPCSSCCYSRVLELRKQDAMKKKLSGASSSSSSSKSTTSRSTTTAKKAEPEKHAGYLFGIKNDKFFYSPVSKKLAKADGASVVKFSSLRDAKKSGRRPDPGSLRIQNPVVPPPEGKECIGRRLPYLRPCRRDADHPTGLCEFCLDGK
jgi:hypothetical protein